MRPRKISNFDHTSTPQRSWFPLRKGFSTTAGTVDEIRIIKVTGNTSKSKHFRPVNPNQPEQRLIKLTRSSVQALLEQDSQSDQDAIRTGAQHPGVLSSSRQTLEPDDHHESYGISCLLESQNIEHPDTFIHPTRPPEGSPFQPRYQEIEDLVETLQSMKSAEEIRKALKAVLRSARKPLQELSLENGQHILQHLRLRRMYREAMEFGEAFRFWKGPPKDCQLSAVLELELILTACLKERRKAGILLSRILGLEKHMDKTALMESSFKLSQLADMFIQQSRRKSRSKDTEVVAMSRFLPKYLQQAVVPWTSHARYSPPLKDDSSRPFRAGMRFATAVLNMQERFVAAAMTAERDLTGQVSLDPIRLKKVVADLEMLETSREPRSGKEKPRPLKLESAASVIESLDLSSCKDEQENLARAIILLGEHHRSDLAHHVFDHFSKQDGIEISSLKFIAEAVAFVHSKHAGLERGMEFFMDIQRRVAYRLDADMIHALVEGAASRNDPRDVQRACGIVESLLAEDSKFRISSNTVSLVLNFARVTGQNNSALRLLLAVQRKASLAVRDEIAIWFMPLFINSLLKSSQSHRLALSLFESLKRAREDVSNHSDSLQHPGLISLNSYRCLIWNTFHSGLNRSWKDRITAVKDVIICMNQDGYTVNTDTFNYCLECMSQQLPTWSSNLEIFQSLQEFFSEQFDVAPNAESFERVLTDASKTGNLEILRKLVLSLNEAGFWVNSRIGNIVMKTLAANHRIGECYDFLMFMRSSEIPRDESTVIPIVKILVEEHLFDSLFKFLEDMKQRDGVDAGFETCKAIIESVDLSRPVSDFLYLHARLKDMIPPHPDYFDSAAKKLVALYVRYRSQTAEASDDLRNDTGGFRSAFSVLLTDLHNSDVVSKLDLPLPLLNDDEAQGSSERQTIGVRYPFPLFRTLLHASAALCHWDSLITLCSNHLWVHQEPLDRRMLMQIVSGFCTTGRFDTALAALCRIANASNQYRFVWDEPKIPYGKCSPQFDEDQVRWIPKLLPMFGNLSAADLKLVLGQYILQVCQGPEMYPVERIRQGHEAMRKAWVGGRAFVSKFNALKVQDVSVTVADGGGGGGSGGGGVGDGITHLQTFEQSLLESSQNIAPTEQDANFSDIGVQQKDDGAEEDGAEEDGAEEDGAEEELAGEDFTLIPLDSHRRIDSPNNIHKRGADCVYYAIDIMQQIVESEPREYSPRSWEAAVVPPRYTVPATVFAGLAHRFPVADSLFQTYVMRISSKAFVRRAYSFEAEHPFWKDEKAYRKYKSALKNTRRNERRREAAIARLVGESMSEMGEDATAPERHED